MSTLTQPKQPSQPTSSAYNTATSLGKTPRPPGTSATNDGSGQVYALSGPSGTSSAYSGAAPMPSGTPVQPNGQLMPYQPTPAPAPAPTTGAQSIGGGVRGVPADLPGGQYQIPGQWGANDAQMQLLMSLFANPYSMSPEVVSQMKGMNRDSAVSMADQARAQMQQGIASRGLNLGGGQAQAGERRLNQAAIQNILSGNREIDIAKAQQDRQDVLGLLGMTNDVLGGQQGRQLAANDFALQRALGLGQLGLGWGGLDLDRDRLGESARQFNMGNQLDWAGLMNNMTMQRAGYGLDLARLQQGSQNDMFNFLMNGGR